MSTDLYKHNVGDVSLDKFELASVKKPGQTDFVTKEEYAERIKEIVKCKQDICYFAERYFKIISLDKGLITIKLYPRQKEMLRHLVENDRSIVLASRQIGKTTCYSIFSTWYTIFNPEKKIMICANKKETSINILSNIAMAYEYLPSWIKPGIVVYNKGELTFNNMSTIKAFATSSSASRGFSGNCVIIDECAFIPNNVTDAFFASVYPVISSSKNSKAILVSTPNGVGNLYYDIWQKANAKNQSGNKDGWKPFRVDWWEVPGRDEEWKSQQIASIGIARFRQEFGNEFIASSYKKLIPDDIIENIRMKQSKDKSAKLNQGTNIELYGKNAEKSYTFKMYNDWKEGHSYLASGDVADGSGGDSSVLYIWDVTNLNNIVPCAKFSSNTISVMEFAFVIAKICAIYKNPFIAVESNSIGRGLIDQLTVTYGYENFVKVNKHAEPGIMSHVQVKSKACLWFREMMTTVGFNISFYDDDIVDEMEAFIRKDTQSHLVYNAIKGQHDDSIICAIWMAYVLSPDIIENYFVVVDHFVSSLGKVLPKTLASLTLDAPVAAEETDQMLKQWKAYKADSEKRYVEALSNEINDTNNDVFFKNAGIHIPDQAFENDLDGNIFIT